ncbi:MAG: 4-hydroxybenzoate 3-monooxygenase [Proteobacteria bacterium]|nr:4-hydroxybenzoate 3-monooxygenase [Pseudomonadota bacterium]
MVEKYKFYVLTSIPPGTAGGDPVAVARVLIGGDVRSTQVVVIGGGPSGLLLSQLLSRNGVASIVLERQSRAYVQGRIRAGLLEWGTVRLLQEAGVGARMMRDGLLHEGVELAFGEQHHRIDLQALTGRSVLVYGQTEVQRDLAEARAAEPGAVVWEAAEVQLAGWDSKRPTVSYLHEGIRYSIACDFIAGCDGYHGVSRASVPPQHLQQYERAYPFGWLALMADVPPLNDELVYANHERGFALCSMRSSSRSRYYLQCSVQDSVDKWPDERFYRELRARLPRQFAQRLVEGRSLEKSIAPLRSFVVEPMRFGSLFLVGDAAHIVPPTGAKGLNLAAADAGTLAQGLIEFYRTGTRTLIDEYSAHALDRVWKATRFSWWFTSLMHKFSEDAFAHQLQLAELRYLAQSETAARAMAENYVGLAIAA